MTDDEILGGILRRYLTDGEYRYVGLGPDWLTLDAAVPITQEEAAVLDRVIGDE